MKADASRERRLAFIERFCQHSSMELPPEPVLRALVQRYGRLIEKLGDELGERPLVLPNGEFFPDEFRKDSKSVRRLAKRMRKHAGMSDIPVKVRIVEIDGGEAGTASCSSGACAPSLPAGQEVARLTEEGDDWVVRVPDVEVEHPVVLTANLARALGHVFVLEASEDEELLRQLDVEGELAAVALGFGPLLLAGSYIYSKSCGGPNVAKVTKLGTPELAVATALFAHVRGHSLRKAIRELDATQQELLEEADGWVKTNDHLVQWLQSDPEKVARGEFSIADTKPWLVRLFDRRKTKTASADAPSLEALLSDPSASLDQIEAMAATLPTAKHEQRAKDPAVDELKALVAQELAESRADAE